MEIINPESRRSFIKRVAVGCAGGLTASDALACCHRRRRRYSSSGNQCSTFRSDADWPVDFGVYRIRCTIGDDRLGYYMALDNRQRIQIVEEPDHPSTQWKFFVKMADPRNLNRFYVIQNMASRKFMHAIDEGDHASLIVDSDETELERYANYISIIPYPSQEPNGTQVFRFQTIVRRLSGDNHDVIWVDSNDRAKVILLHYDQIRLGIHLWRPRRVS